MTADEIALVLLDKLSQILAIEAESFTYPWKKTLYLKEFNNPRAFLFAVKIKHREPKDRICACIGIRVPIA